MTKQTITMTPDMIIGGGRVLIKTPREPILNPMQQALADEIYNNIKSGNKGVFHIPSGRCYGGQLIQRDVMERLAADGEKIGVIKKKDGKIVCEPFKTKE